VGFGGITAGGGVQPTPGGPTTVGTKLASLLGPAALGLMGRGGGALINALGLGEQPLPPQVAGPPRPAQPWVSSNATANAPYRTL
jgi:hypothetical protein